MQCLILAGGLGTRMQSVSDHVPKTLIPVNGTPFAHHQMTWLAEQSIRRVVYSLGHMASQVMEYVGDGSRWGIDVRYVDEGSSPIGTGGAVRLAVDNGEMDDGFFVLYGDSYLSVNFASVWAASDEGQNPVMTVLANEGRWDQSNTIFQDGKITHHEKNRDDAADIGMRHIDYGLSVLTAKAVRDGETPRDLADLYSRLSRTGELRGFEVFERFYEVGSPQGLADLEAYLKDLS
jgi:NDP-sugar pyrophosphorylase family protein